MKALDDRPVLTERAPAKVNLTLHVLGRRPDGYHEIESLVVFAGAADRLTLRPSPELSLTVEGPTAEAAGPPAENLVLRVVRALVERRPTLAVGAFHLVKRLPAAAGIGGGSSDAAAALRLVARLNDLPQDDPDVIAAARATGADIPVCLDPCGRMMRGAGEKVGPPVVLPPLYGVLVNPGVAVSTADIFRALGLVPGARYGGAPHPDIEGTALGDGTAALDEALAAARNDLESLATGIAPEIGVALSRLSATAHCRLVRMTGSGATVFGLYPDCHAAARAARTIRSEEPAWWVKPTVLR